MSRQDLRRTRHPRPPAGSGTGALERGPGSRRRRGWAVHFTFGPGVELAGGRPAGWSQRRWSPTTARRCRGRAPADRAGGSAAPPSSPRRCPCPLHGVLHRTLPGRRAAGPATASRRSLRRGRSRSASVANEGLRHWARTVEAARCQRRERPRPVPRAENPAVGRTSGSTPRAGGGGDRRVAPGEPLGRGGLCSGRENPRHAEARDARSPPARSPPEPIRRPGQRDRLLADTPSAHPAREGVREACTFLLIPTDKTVIGRPATGVRACHGHHRPDHAGDGALHEPHVLRLAPRSRLCRARAHRVETAALKNNLPRTRARRRAAAGRALRKGDVLVDRLGRKPRLSGQHRVVICTVLVWRARSRKPMAVNRLRGRAIRPRG